MEGQSMRRTRLGDYSTSRFFIFYGDEQMQYYAEDVRTGLQDSWDISIFLILLSS
jgi:hypothetical protein